MNGAPALLIPDNLKSAIKSACRYEPEATSTYQDFARHYSTAILPARPFHPRDKPAVEMSVLVVQRWILARLRNRQFFSLAELNIAIAELLVDLNRRPFKKLPGCRAEAFEAIDRPALRPLPATRYEYAEMSKVKVNIDYHVEVDRYYYSVPHALVGQYLMARYTDTTVECFHKGERVAVHVRSYQDGKFTTLPEHMPKSHRKHLKWTPGRLLNWGEKIGPGARAVVQWQFDHRPHPEQGYRACLGLLALSKEYGEERLEGACRRALTIGCPTGKRIKMILVAKLDQHPDMFPAAETAAPTATRTHANVRGANYFRSESTMTDETTTTTDEGDNDSCSSNPRSIN
jgi:transposase